MYKFFVSHQKPTPNKDKEKHIGFDGIPYALINKSMKKGFVFNILCIGETGIGKSTLMSSLFNTNFESSPNLHNSEDVKLKVNVYNLQEYDVKLKLTIVETVGYGDQINKEDTFEKIVEYVNAQYDLYLQEEMKFNRDLSNFHDSRIHACLYFICPTGHGLKAIDLLCLKKLNNKVNIIPIIAKADCISKNEISKFKKKVIDELQSNDINIYTFPPDDDSAGQVNSKMNYYVPFAVVGSTDFAYCHDTLLRCRQYPWGTVEVENEDHSDFAKLREMLIRTNMEDMYDRTRTIYYETYRKNKLQSVGLEDSTDEDLNYFQNYQRIRTIMLNNNKANEEMLRKKMAKRIEDVSIELKKEEKQLRTKYDKMKEDIENKMIELIMNREKLEDEIRDFAEIQSEMTTMQYQSVFYMRKTRKS